MSRPIDPELQQIMEARYGEEVRGSIVSALEKTYDTCSDIDDTVVATTKVWSSKKTSDEIAKGSDEIIVSPSTPSSQYNKLWIKDQAETEYTVPTYQEFGDLKSAIEDIDNELAEAAQDETGRTLVEYETYSAGLTESALKVIGTLFDNLPQDSSLTDITNSIALECERLELIYNGWIAERSA